MEPRNIRTTTYSDFQDSQDLSKLHDLNATGLELVSDTLPSLLSRQARLRPNSLAVDSYQCQWTFAQLKKMVNGIAAMLREYGIRASHRVGICFHLSPSAVASILALLTLGAAVVPVDPAHPVSRRISMLREAGVELVAAADGNCIEELAAFSFTMIDVSVIGLDPEHVSAPSLFNADQETSPMDDAFIAFTSGSSGKPKGIRQTHDAIVTMCIALAEQLDVSEKSRVAQFHPYIFDVAAMEIGMCLFKGSVLCIPKKEDMMLPTPGEIGFQLSKFQVTHCTLSPTMLGMIEPAEIPTVQTLSVMGEPLGRSAVHKWASNSSRNFYQLWGCTEATILQTITPPIARNSNPQNIGKAISSTCRLWIVDPKDFHRLMVDGEQGELVVESRCLARGYLNQAAETEQKFHSYVLWSNKSSQGRLYQTGDLARKEVDGSITFLGRLDTQINYHGERIELGEIDYCLDQLRPAESSDCFSDFDDSSQTIVGFVCGPKTKMRGAGHEDPTILWSESGVSKASMAHLTNECLRQGKLAPYSEYRSSPKIFRDPGFLSENLSQDYDFRFKSLIPKLCDRQR